MEYTRGMSEGAGSAASGPAGQLPATGPCYHQRCHQSPLGECQLPKLAPSGTGPMPSLAGREWWTRALRS